MGTREEEEGRGVEEEGWKREPRKFRAAATTRGTAAEFNNTARAREDHV